MTPTQGVITLGDVSEPVLFRVDTSAGVVTAVSCAPAVPPGCRRRRRVHARRDHLGGTMRPDLDPTTGNEITAPDGSPLPILFARLDQAGAITVAEVAGPPRLDVDKIVHHFMAFDIGDGTTLTVYRDPATGEIARRAAVPVAFDPTRSSSFRGFVIDDQFMVVATQPGSFVDEPSASMVFRASLRPVGS